MNSSEEIFHPIKTVRASEAIYEQIKDKIVSGEIKPGERLPSERNMMEIFQRSRPTIREALRMLERSGYIRTIPGSNGAVVTLPSGKNMEESIEDALQIGQISIAEVSEYRIISEGATAAWAALRATDEDLAELKACLDEMQNSLADHDAFTSLDTRFHSLITKAAKNRVSDLMNKTLSRLNRAFATKRYDELSEEGKCDMCERIQKMHTGIYKAIASHDPERARRQMEEHVKVFFQDLS